ncbi:MAG: solute carrier family 23 protein [Tabrizicola sp.]|uniref:solute carrier family 23 protein n=1 Tax=Tabrizicola sp. TaxID=2005166 RepID=UPI00273443FC|nr:solute carrier family 23 protein [Tabrizicola sp.]MDP3264049.1 solute carrier family 23 protein [Tabrizicola sp.]
MIESTGMFLTLGDMTGKPVTQPMLSAGLRTDGLGTLIGGIFNTFPYTSFSRNVGRVGVTGINSRFVCFAVGLILIVLGLVRKMGAQVESVPPMVLGGAGLVMFGRVAATVIRNLAGVNFAANRNNRFTVAVPLGFGMIPLIAQNFKQWMPHDIHPLVEHGILFASVAAVLLNALFNGAKGAAMAADHPPTASPSWGGAGGAVGPTTNRQMQNGGSLRYPRFKSQIAGKAYARARFTADSRPSRPDSMSNVTAWPSFS